MLGGTVAFAAIAALAGVIGFSGVAPRFSAAARVLFFVFAALCILSLLMRDQLIHI